MGNLERVGIALESLINHGGDKNEFNCHKDKEKHCFPQHEITLLFHHLLRSAPYMASFLQSQCFSIHGFLFTITVFYFKPYTPSSSKQIKRLFKVKLQCKNTKPLTWNNRM